MVTIEKALKVEGWMTPAELQWLAEHASKRHMIAEVGSWMGRSTRALIDNTPGHVVAVDTWKGSDEPYHKKLLADKSPDWLFEQFMGNMSGVTNLIAMRYTSLQAARAWKEQNRFEVELFDMIFLDASHDYDNVLADVSAWTPLLAPGGLLCGHDFGGSFNGVQHAVRHVHPTACKVGAGSIWSVPLA